MSSRTPRVRVTPSGAFTVPPGGRFRLGRIDPDATGEFSSKRDAAKTTRASLEQLRELHERLYAGGRRGFLVVLQAMDTGGKDGTIKHVMGAFNPQGVRVTSFKVPTDAELAHDFLWRVHKVAPARGQIAIFNRSHYEDVLVVRVKGLQPEAVWRGRYDHINHFERLLAEAGIAIVKLYLHISPEEQAERLRERQRVPEKNWKFNPGDLEDRRLWHEFRSAYEDALSLCNTPWAPWYVVPANHKWYRNVVVAGTLVAAMESMHLHYPPAAPDIAGYRIPEV